MRTANILDPIHETLDPTVFDHADKEHPKLKPKHRKWLKETIYRVLDGAGYDGMDEWLQLVFTGSLTTYQYSADSDVDVSLFVNVDKLPEWSRAEMIGLMVENFDGTKMPGTTHPTQGFVCPSDVDPTDLYKPGLRSGYDLTTDSWLVPPEKGRTLDVQREKNAAYVHALEQADKMDRLLKYEPDKAVMFWHQIHKRRRRDHQAGKGDYSDSNITYKMLANRGLFPEISQASGEYIAKTGTDENYPDHVWQQGMCGTYACALIAANPELRLGVAGNTMDDGWWPNHYFAHDDTHAYDSLGKHELPYHGIKGQFDVSELNHNAEDWGLPEQEAGPYGSEEDMAAALAHWQRQSKTAADWAWNPTQPQPQEMRLNQKGCSYCGATLNPTDTVCPQCLNSNAPQTSTEWQNLPHALNQPAQPVARTAIFGLGEEHPADSEGNKLDRYVHPKDYYGHHYPHYNDFEDKPGMGLAHATRQLHELNGAFSADKVSTERYEQLTDQVYGDLQKRGIPQDHWPIHENGYTFIRPDRAYAVTNQDLSKGYDPNARWRYKDEKGRRWENRPELHREIPEQIPAGHSVYEVHNPGPVAVTNPLYNHNAYHSMGSNKVPAENVRQMDPEEYDPSLAPAAADQWSFSSSILPPQEHIEHARQQLGLQHPVRVLPTYKNRGGYAGVTRDPMSGKPSHLLYVNPEQHEGARNWALWHELGHAQRVEQGGEFEPNNEMSDEEYWEHPNEQHAEEVANQYADYDLFAKQAAPKKKSTLVRKFVYNADTDQLLVGPLAREEGEVLSHNQLAAQIGGADESGTINAHGWAAWEWQGGALGKQPTDLNQYQVKYRAQQKLKEELGPEIQGWLGGEQQNLGWDEGWTE